MARKPSTKSPQPRASTRLPPSATEAELTKQEPTPDEEARLDAEADDLAKLRAAVDADAGSVSPLWISFLLFGTYLAIAVGSVDHRQLLLEVPIKLPVLGVDLPLVAFFIIAPFFFVVFHTYFLINLTMMADDIRRYGYILRSRTDKPATERHLRQQLPNFIFLRMLGGPRRDRANPTDWLLVAIGWLTVVIGPVMLLVFAQLQFLPFHNGWATWAQRALIVVDLLLLWWFWPAILLDLAMGASLKTVVQVIAGVVSVYLVVFCVVVATFPGERLNSIAVAAPAVGFFFEGRPNEVTGKPTSWLSNRLVLPDQDFVDDDTLLKIVSHDFGAAPWKGERTRSLRGRDLRAAVLARADLRRADFTGANLDGAQLDGALLAGSLFGCADTQDNQIGVDLWEEVCASLEGASLTLAELQGASFDDADLQGASLAGAELQGASLSGAQLQGAIMTGAQLQGAILSDANLTSAVLSQARLQGASLQGATLSGADLRETWLHGADLSSADLQGAELENARLLGATMWPARLKGSSLHGAQLQGVDLEVAELEALSLGSANVWRSFPPTASHVEFADFSALEPDRKYLTAYRDFQTQARVPKELDMTGYLALREEAVTGIRDPVVRARVLERLTVLSPNAWISGWPAERDRANLTAWRSLEKEWGDSRKNYPRMLADYLIELGCRSDAAPFVVSCLFYNGRVEATGEYGMEVLARFMKDCPGSVGITDVEWARFQEIASGTLGNED